MSTHKKKNQEFPEGGYTVSSFSFVFNKNTTMLINKEKNSIRLVPLSTVMNGSGFHSDQNVIDQVYYKIPRE